jgi:hypothetical protein
MELLNVLKLRMSAERKKGVSVKRLGLRGRASGREGRRSSSHKGH